MGGDSQYSFQDLREALLAVRKEKEGDAGIVAILWTWLDSHLLNLGSLEEKPPSIRQAAYRAAPYGGVNEVVLKWLEKSPLRNAAELLAQIGRSFEVRDEPLLELKPGIDENEVIVAVRRPSLALAMRNESGEEGPPGSAEHPSLSTLAPRLLVCPLKMHEIELQVLDTLSDEWDLALAPLEQRGKDPPIPSSLCIHLDTLGEHGLSGWSVDNGQPAGRYKPEAIAADDERDSIAAAKVAVKKASGTPSLLLMPELAAPPSVLDAIAGELDGRADLPLLTVVGAYHRLPEETDPIDPDLVGEGTVAQHVNEAVVFGPDGTELWSQRKVSCAGAGAHPPADPGLVEDTRPGRQLKLVSTPLGTLAVVICLDSFHQTVRDRIAASPAEVLLVPSLSPTVHRHQDSLQQLVQVLWGAAFVCNRSPFGKDSPYNPEKISVWNDKGNRSFWVLQRASVTRPRAKAKGAYPSFVYRLSASLQVRKKGSK